MLVSTVDMKLDPKDFDGIDIRALVEGAQRFARPDASETDPVILEALRLADERLERRIKIIEGDQYDS